MQEFQHFNPSVANEGRVQDELRGNALVISKADQQGKQVAEDLERITVDNRDGLNRYFAGQLNSRSHNVVKGIGSNFGRAAETRPADRAQTASTQLFSNSWFDANGLGTTRPESTLTWDVAFAGDELGDLKKDMNGAANAAANVQGVANVVFDLSLGDQPGKPSQPEAPSVAQKAGQADFGMNGRPPKTVAMKMEVGGGEGRVGDKSVTRYKAALRERNDRQKQLRGYGGYGYQGGGQEPAGVRAGQAFDSIAGGSTDIPVVSSDGQAIYGVFDGYDGSRGEVSALTLGQNFVPSDTPAGGPATQPARMQIPSGVVVPSAGLASLDVDIPVRGRVYFFTTPRGKVEITARAVSRRFISNAGYLVTVILALVAGILAYRVVCRDHFLADNSGRLAAAAIILGVAAVIVGVLPVAGLLVALTGIIVRISRRRRRPLTLQPAA